MGAVIDPVVADHPVARVIDRHVTARIERLAARDDDPDVLHVVDPTVADHKTIDVAGDRHRLAGPRTDVEDLASVDEQIPDRTVVVRPHRQDGMGAAPVLAAVLQRRVADVVDLAPAERDAACRPADVESLRIAVGRRIDGMAHMQVLEGHVIDLDAHQGLKPAGDLKPRTVDLHRLARTGRQGNHPPALARHRRADKLMVGAPAHQHGITRGHPSQCAVDRPQRLVLGSGGRIVTRGGDVIAPGSHHPGFGCPAGTAPSDRPRRVGGRLSRTAGGDSRQKGQDQGHCSFSVHGPNRFTGTPRCSPCPPPCADSRQSPQYRRNRPEEPFPGS